MAAVAARGEGTRRPLRGTQSRLDRVAFSASLFSTPPTSAVPSFGGCLRFAALLSSMRAGGGGRGGGRGDGRGGGRLHCGEAGRAANAL